MVEHRASGSQFQKCLVHHPKQRALAIINHDEAHDFVLIPFKFVIMPEGGRESRHFFFRLDLLFAHPATKKNYHIVSTKAYRATTNTFLVEKRATLTSAISYVAHLCQTHMTCHSEQSKSKLLRT